MKNNSQRIPTFRIYLPMAYLEILNKWGKEQKQKKNKNAL